MKLGAVYSESVGALYRVAMPMMGLQARGHEVVGVQLGPGRPLDVRALAGCELVQFHRLPPDDAYDAAVAQLRDAGVLISFDDDGCVSPEDAAFEPLFGRERFAAGLERTRRLLARLPEVDLVTTPSEALADRFEEAGAPAIEVIDSFLLDRFVGPRPCGHDGFVIGWHACGEHLLDAERLDVADVLGRILDTHEHVRVVTIGLTLPLEHERYEARRPVPFDTLTQQLADFDLGLAPLAATPFGLTRSNVKLREYAAAGVPWLASDLGPYAALGRAQGGELVADDDWFAAIDTVIHSERDHGDQRARARRWGADETIASMCSLWEDAFGDTLAARS